MHAMSSCPCHMDGLYDRLQENIAQIAARPCCACPCQCSTPSGHAPCPPQLSICRLKQQFDGLFETSRAEALGISAVQVPPGFGPASIGVWGGGRY